MCVCAPVFVCGNCVGFCLVSLALQKLLESCTPMNGKVFCCQCDTESSLFSLSFS